MSHVDAASVADVLERAATVLEQPRAWTQGTYARDEHGEATGCGFSGDAVCFCMLGVLEHVTGNFHPAIRAARFINLAIGREPDAPAVASVGRWNDTPGRTQAEVVAKLREAAALARTKGGAA